MDSEIAMKNNNILAFVLACVVGCFAVPKPMESVENYNILMVHGAYGASKGFGNIPYVFSHVYDSLPWPIDSLPSWEILKLIYYKDSILELVDNYIFPEANEDTSFLGSVHYVLIPKFEINVYIGNFIASVIRAKFYKRYDFIEMCTQKMLKKESISLPVLTNGLPDWDYMESSMKGFMFESESRLGKIKCVSPTRNVVNTNAWGEFVVGELFDKLDLKCRKANFNKVLDCSEYPDEEFSLPLVNAKHFNNGIQFYGRPDEWESAKMTIDIVSNGAVATGDVYAQPQRTGVLWDAYLIKCHYEIKSEYVLHLLACVIEKCVKQYFGWDEKCTWEKVKKKMIKLPVSSNGEPDWVSMESCMKRIMDEFEKRIECLRMGLTQEYML